MQMQMEDVECVTNNLTLSSLLRPSHSQVPAPGRGDITSMLTCHLHRISPAHWLLSRRHCQHPQITHSFMLQCLVSLGLPEKPWLLGEQRLNPGLLSWLGSVQS